MPIVYLNFIVFSACKYRKRGEASRAYLLLGSRSYRILRLPRHRSLRHRIDLSTKLQSIEICDLMISALRVREAIARFTHQIQRNFANSKTFLHIRPCHTGLQAERSQIEAAIRSYLDLLPRTARIYLIYWFGFLRDLKRSEILAMVRSTNVCDGLKIS